MGMSFREIGFSQKSLFLCSLRELVDMEAVLDKSRLLLSSSNSVDNCLLNNKTGGPMMFADSKFSANQKDGEYVINKHKFTAA